MNDDVKNDSVEAAETEAPEVNHVNNMVSSLVDGDNIAAQDSFKNALTDKIGSALDENEAEDSSSEETPAEQEGEEEVEQEDEPVVS
jgi:hypothetical protein